LLDRRQLIPTGRETWEGVKVVIDAVLRRAREQPQSRRSEYSNNFTKRLSQFKIPIGLPQFSNKISFSNANCGDGTSPVASGHISASANSARTTASGTFA
jgi:hypothetical protein